FSSYQELLLEHARLINWLKHEKEITIESIRNNLSAHVIHEILFEKGSGLGKDKRKVNKDIVVSMKDNRSQDNKAIFDTENPVKPRRDFTEKTVVAEVTQINKSDRVNGSEMITKAEDVEMRRIVLETFNVFEEYPGEKLDWLSPYSEISLYDKGYKGLADGLSLLGIDYKAYECLELDIDVSGMGHVNVYYGEIWIKVTKIPADKIKALLNLIRNYLRGNDLKEAIRIIESSPIDTLKDKEANSDAFDGANDSAKLRPDFTEERKLNKSTHPISAQSQFDAPKDYDFAKPFTPEFRYLAEDIKTICQYLKDSGKITGPPEGFNALTFALAYHKDGQMYWAENLTEKDIRETIQVLSRQGKLHLAEETIIIHIKIHESKLTEEEAIRAQIGYILTTNNKDTYENLKMIADKRKELKENKESLSSVVDYVIETKEKDSVFPVPPKRLDNKDYWDGVDEGIKPFEGSLLWKIFIPGRHPSVKGQALPGAKSTYCLLCPSLRSPYDTGWRIDENWETKPNMYPIFKRHGMIIYVEHKEQFIDSTIIEKILEWSKKASPYRVIYNGRKAGATIPGHEHIQLVRDLKPLPIKHSPLEKIASNAENIDSIKEKTIEPQVSIIKNFPSSDNPIVVFLVEGVNGDTVRADIEKIVSILANRGIDVDVISAYNENSWRVFIIPRPYEAIAKEDGINPKTAGKRKETKVEVALDNLLGKEGKVVEHRTQPRVMAFVEFMGIFVAVDEEQYKNISLENFITVLNELGLSRKDATPVIEEIKVALEKDIAPQQQPRTPNPDKDINPSSLLIKRNLMDLYPEEILEMNQGFLYG
ncbi:MAG: DUF4922 domain-containing protein, partial [Candidatus Omnitrophica bacterium]|nr:DUF4922 domain-containing protein [Candidatus Omnitrophota bacterium]